jgi:hypothetical protein
MSRERSRFGRLGKLKQQYAENTLSSIILKPKTEHIQDLFNELQSNIFNEISKSNSYTTKSILLNSTIKCLKEFYFKAKRTLSTSHSTDKNSTPLSVSNQNQVAPYKFLAANHQASSIIDFDDLVNLDEKFTVLLLLYVDLFNVDMSTKLYNCDFEPSEHYSSSSDAYFMYMFYMGRVDSRLRELCHYSIMSTASLPLKAISFVHIMFGLLQHPATNMQTAMLSQSIEHLLIRIMKAQIEQQSLAESSMCSFSSLSSLFGNSTTTNSSSSFMQSPQSACPLIAEEISPILRYDVKFNSPCSSPDNHSFSGGSCLDIIQWSSQLIGFLASNI